MHVTVYHPDPTKRDEFIVALRTKLPNGARIDEIADASTDYLVAWSPPRSIFASAPGIKACFNLGAGVDFLIKNDALPPSVPLYRLEDAGMGDQMARYCRHETEHFRLQNWRYADQQNDHQWLEHEPPDPAQLTIGLYGYGVLGRPIAALLQSDGYPVRAFRRSPSTGGEGLPVYSGQSELAQFLGGCNVLIVIAPLTRETRGVINERTIAMLPPGAWIVNVARGELIVEADLLAAIDSGHLTGASLDVFAVEPLPPEHPFWNERRIRITPHVAALTRVADAVGQISGKIAQLEDGGSPSGLVRRELGY